MVFNEDLRVKLPCVLHLIRLGYRYLSFKNATWDEETNIFPVLFRTAIARINPSIDEDDIDRLLDDVKLALENEDLGKAFYERLTDRSGTRLVDFANFANNSFNVVTELTYKNGDEEFRPDIVLLVNGMPLVFIEVKKPNNREGILAERNRIITRCRNPRFRRFINITQLMVFSNNMEYDDGTPVPTEGAFYASREPHGCRLTRGGYLPRSPGKDRCFRYRRRQCTAGWEIRLISPLRTFILGYAVKIN